MTGSLQESHYDVVKAEHESDQQQLSQFCSNADAPTTIAVVSRPSDTGIEQVCDEWMPELGMPEDDLKRYWSYRSGFRTNSAVDNPAKRAWNEANLAQRYVEHIIESEKAQMALSRLVCRLENGEDVTLVCFEDPTEPCHRHILVEVIESRLSSKYNFSKKRLSA